MVEEAPTCHCLSWDDLDLDAGTLRVRRALQRQSGKGLVVVDRKSTTSRRTVDLTAIAIQALCGHRTQWIERRLLVGDKWRGTDVVFVSDVGSPLDPSGMAERLTRRLVHANLPKIRVHDLLALQQGVHPKAVQVMLGWTYAENETVGDQAGGCAYVVRFHLCSTLPEWLHQTNRQLLRTCFSATYSDHCASE